jgi:hypothetical protein
MLGQVVLTPSGRKTLERSPHSVPTRTVERERFVTEGIEVGSDAAVCSGKRLGRIEQLSSLSSAPMHFGDPQALHVEPAPGDAANQAADYGSIVIARVDRDIRAIPFTPEWAQMIMETPCDDGVCVGIRGRGDFDDGQ